MKKNILKFCILLLCLFSNVIVFAQATEDPPACPECPETPIDNRLIFLAIAGLAFAVYYFNSKKTRTA